MRLPLTLTLIVLAGSAAGAAPSPAKRRAAPAAPLKAAGGVARSLLPPARGAAKAAPRDTLVPPPPPRRATPAPAGALPKAPAALEAPLPASTGVATPASTPPEGAGPPPAAPPAGTDAKLSRPPARSAPAALPASGASPKAAPQSPTPNAERRTPNAEPPSLLPPPPLTLSPSRAVVPLGESRVITITGAVEAPEAVPSAPDIIAVTVSPAPLPGAWNLTLRGLAAGEGSLRVTASSDREQLLTARVMKYAGRVVPAVVEVTGQPAPAEFVLQAARQVVDEAVQREPGATVTVGKPAAAPPELPAGQAATLSFPVSLAGPDLLPTKSVAQVTVRNRDVEPREVGVLFYSNDPERVTRPGSLFAAELAPDHPARLLYHHINAGQEPLRLRLEIVNPTDQPADLQVIEGLAGPTWDPVEAGHRAAARYLRSALHEIGTVVHVAAQSQQTIAVQRMAATNTVSGLLTLRSLGGKLYLRIVAEPESEPLVATRPAETPAELSDHVYPSPRRPLKARYVVGQNWVFLKLGGDPLVGRGSHKKLEGNYGVSYEMAIEISNPTDQPQDVALTLSPDAGHARGVFVIDGAIVEAEPVTPPVEADLATFHLQPGERRAVRVETIPVGGSSYPARVVVRPAHPVRAAQTPVNAR